VLESVAQGAACSYRRGVRALALAAALLGALALAGASPAGDPKPLRVLFVGNSLTAANDLPAYVAAIALARGRTLEHLTIAPGGYSLEDHWNAGAARDALHTGSWDVAVFQQGPSALRESEADLKVWATRFADEARTAGTTPALLTVWPESYRKASLVTVIASYRRSAQAAGALLIPAGKAWRFAWACNHNLPLYGSDGFHPSPLGTYTAALVVYARLFNASPWKAPASLRLYGVAFAAKRATARLVQAAAAGAVGMRPRTVSRCGGRVST
jgi:hypothetical protein